MESLAPLVVAGEGGAVAARVRLRALTDATLSSTLTLRTNLTDYSLPLLLYTGRLDVVSLPPTSSQSQHSSLNKKILLFLSLRFYNITKT